MLWPAKAPAGPTGSLEASRARDGGIGDERHDRRTVGANLTLHVVFFFVRIVGPLALPARRRLGAS